MPSGHHGNAPARRRTRITVGALGVIFWRSLSGWWNDNVPRLGASLAYYTLFALAPILVVAIAIGGLVFGPEAVRGEIVGQIQGLIGREGAMAVQAMLEGASRRSSSIVATVAGIITFFLGATGAFLELQTALNSIWHVEPKSDGSFWRELIDAEGDLVRPGSGDGVSAAHILAGERSSGGNPSVFGQCVPWGGGALGSAECDRVSYRDHAAVRLDLQGAAGCTTILERCLGRGLW